ncbi:MAG: MFS transporter [Chloroflexi bacterium]|nr:MFS transporter [Chloroflexota bacterium]
MQQTPIPNTPDGNTPVSEPKGGRWPSLPPALRYTAYRYYWLGLVASVTGYQMFRVAQAWYVYELTGSALWLGFAALANAVPGMFFNLFGGVFADRLNKRLLVMATQAAAAAIIFVLAVLALLGVANEWHVMIIAFLAGAVEAFDNPARQAIYPHLIDRRVMMSAVALNSSVWSGTRIIGPVLAGFIVEFRGMETAFFVAGGGFTVMALVMLFLKVPPIPRGSRGNPAQDLLEGLQFIKRNSIFAFLITMTFFNSFFGMSYVFLIPVFAQENLGLGAKEYGTLLSASGVGSLIVTFWLVSRSSIGSKGVLVIGGALLFGISLIAFGLTSRYIGSYQLALAILFFVGISTSVVNISIQSALQTLVPDAVRGRVMGFYSMTWSIMPMGGMLAGALASVGAITILGGVIVIGAPFAVVIGGSAVAAFALGPALFNPKIRNLDTVLAQTTSTPGATGPTQEGGSEPAPARADAGPRP